MGIRDYRRYHKPRLHKMFSEEEQLEAFWRKVDKKGPDECWNWTAHLVEGYGNVWLHGNVIGAHVFSYKLANGIVPEGKIICHTCHNRACVNPSHLYAGTNGDNMRDSYASGNRKLPKQMRPMFKNGELWLMRKLRNAGITVPIIARIFKCAGSTVYQYTSVR